MSEYFEDGTLPVFSLTGIWFWGVLVVAGLSNMVVSTVQSEFVDANKKC